MNPISRLQRLDLHSLYLFANVAKDGSISRAAERSHIAPSAVSRRLADLEQVIGAALFVRSSKGKVAQVTDVGRVVLQRAERIHAELKCLLEDASAVQDAQTTVRLFASHSVIGGVLPELMRAFKPDKTNARVEICEASSAEVVSACVDGIADVAIGLGVHSPLLDSLDSWELFSDQLQVVMREDHLLARHADVSFEQALAFPIVGSNPSGALCEQLHHEAWKLGLNVNTPVTASNFQTACRLAESGLGLAIMPGTAIPVGLGKPLVRRPLREAWAQRALTLYASKKRTPTSSSTALLEHLRRQTRMHSALRMNRETFQPVPGFEAQFTVATLLPFTCKSAVSRTPESLVGAAELYKP